VSLVTLAALLFGSGAAALVYETLWVKQVGLVVGVDVYAVTTVVGAFFAGLAGGSAVFGARADRARRPLAFYAALEAGIALFAVATTLGLAHLAPLYARVGQLSDRLAWLLPFALVAAPAMFMGGTLPAALRAGSPRGAASSMPPTRPGVCSGRSRHPGSW
jgi:spermidine synthase